MKSLISNITGTAKYTKIGNKVNVNYHVKNISGGSTTTVISSNKHYHLHHWS